MILQELRKLPNVWLTNILYNQLVSISAEASLCSLITVLSLPYLQQLGLFGAHFIFRLQRTVCVPCPPLVGMPRGSPNSSWACHPPHIHLFDKRFRLSTKGCFGRQYSVGHIFCIIGVEKLYSYPLNTTWWNFQNSFFCSFFNTLNFTFKYDINQMRNLFF